LKGSIIAPFSFVLVVGIGFEPTTSVMAAGITKDLLKQAKGFVKGAARITAYRTMPTVEWS
jgi:hypothetical protein